MRLKKIVLAMGALGLGMATGMVSSPALAAEKSMPALTGWNLDNTLTVNGADPDGRTWIYPDAVTKALDLAGDGTGSRGYVIWELDDASGESPGIQVRTDELVDDWALRNCIMASGEGKACGDDSGTSKRFKLRVTGSESEPVDLVFDVADDQPFTYDDTLVPEDITGRIYRVLMKWSNFTDARAQGFRVQLYCGNASEDNLVAAGEPGCPAVEWELRPTVTRASLGEAGGGEDREVWKPEEFSTFSPSMYTSDDPDTADVTESGFFDDEVAGLFPPQQTGPEEIYSGEDVVVSPILGSTTLNFFDRWGYMLNEALLPTGIYQDADGDAATEGKLIAFWDGTVWRYGAPAFAEVPDADLAVWAAAPLDEDVPADPPEMRYEAAVIDDLAGLNTDVYIWLDETYDVATHGDTITMRIVPVAPAGDIVGNEANPEWLANPAPDIFAEPVDPVVPAPTDDDSGGGGGGCTVGGDGRFDPTLPALLAAALGMLGWRRLKASH